MDRQLQRPDNFAEFDNEINYIKDDLIELSNNDWVKGRKISSEAINIG